MTSSECLSAPSMEHLPALLRVELAYYLNLVDLAWIDVKLRDLESARWLLQSAKSQRAFIAELTGSDGYSQDFLRECSEAERQMGLLTRILEPAPEHTAERREVYSLYGQQQIF